MRLKRCTSGYKAQYRQFYGSFTGGLNDSFIDQFNTAFKTGSFFNVSFKNKSLQMLMYRRYGIYSQTFRNFNQSGGIAMPLNILGDEIKSLSFAVIKYRCHKRKLKN